MNSPTLASDGDHMHRYLIASAIINLAFLIGTTTATTAEETRVQHREWMKKFGNPGGSLNGPIAAQDTKIYQIDLQDCRVLEKDDRSNAPEAC
jgi:hypothetical protein